MRRRRFLRGVGVTAVAAAAGCGAADESQTRTVNPALAGTPTQSSTPTATATAWAAPASAVVPAVLLGGHVVVSRGPPEAPRVVGLDPADGSVDWRREYDAPVRADTDGRLLGLSSEIAADEPFGTLVDPETGRRLWRTDAVLGVEATTATRAVVELWRTDGRGPDRNAVLEADGLGDWGPVWRVRGDPRLFDGDRLYLTRMDGRVATVEARTTDGTVVWRRGWETTAGVAWLGHHDGHCVVAVGDTVRALSLSDGETRARASNRFGLDAAVVAGEERLYLGAGVPGGDGGGLLVLDTAGGRFDWQPLEAAARPVAVRDGPVVQFVDERGRWVASYDRSLSRRWRRGGTAVAEDDLGLYLAAGRRLAAVDDGGEVRWRVTPEVGSGSAPLDGLREREATRVRLGPALVVAGSRGMVSYDPRDGTERVRAEGLGPVRRVLPRQWLDRPTPPSGDRVVLVTGGAVHAVPV
ncbi:PQQ-binding-like beta-propeller repeat protein [Halobaculum sp. MBLA0143]|uniref:outer membrane protein assembly factor BamB family protein n=1 Tax=Halobaculum sp. MBLA0143 TaxID=3079933 RepID=UPI003525BCB8